MTTAVIRLLFAGALALISLLAALCVGLVGMLKGMNVSDIAVASGPFVAVTTASVGFFMGHSNGVNSIHEAEDRGALQQRDGTRDWKGDPPS